MDHFQTISTQEIIVITNDPQTAMFYLHILLYSTLIELFIEFVPICATCTMGSYMHHFLFVSDKN